MKIEKCSPYGIDSTVEGMSMADAREYINEVEARYYHYTSNTNMTKADVMEAYKKRALIGWCISTARANISMRVLAVTPEFKKEKSSLGSGATLKPFKNTKLRDETDEEYDDRLDFEDMYRGSPESIIPLSAKVAMNIPGVRKRGCVS
jgi:hypothetical protein